MDITYKGLYIDVVIADLPDFTPKCGTLKYLFFRFVFVIINGSKMVTDDVMSFFYCYSLEIKLFTYIYIIYMPQM